MCFIGTCIFLLASYAFIRKIKAQCFYIKLSGVEIPSSVSFYVEFLLCASNFAQICIFCTIKLKFGMQTTRTLIYKDFKSDARCTPLQVVKVVQSFFVFVSFLVMCVLHSVLFDGSNEAGGNGQSRKSLWINFMTND